MSNVAQNNGKCKINKGDRLTMNVPFFQVPNSIFDDDHDLKVWEIAVYCYLARCGNQGNSAFPSLDTIGRKCGMSRRKAADSINKLIDKGYLKRTTKKGIGCEYTILYNSEPVQDMHGGSAPRARVTSAPRAHKEELSFNKNNKESTDQPEKEPAPSHDLLNDEKPKTAVKEVIALMCDLYKERFNINYPVSEGKDHAIIKRLINEHGLDTVKEIIRLHVKTDDNWIIERGCAVATIKNSLPGYLTQISKVRAEEEAEARQREIDRQRQEQWKREEEEKARERAEYEALPEVDKIRKKLENDVIMLEVMKKGRDDDAQHGDINAIDYLLKYVRRVKDRLEELKAAGGEEADQLLKEMEVEEKRYLQYKQAEPSLI